MSENQSVIKIIECPRDAMQGIKVFIPTESKIEYLNALLKVGFDTIDAGSFVSPRYVPQMVDTPEVLEKIEWKDSGSKLSVIVANVRGAIEASRFPQISYLGYPFSISETFQLRNTNSDMQKAMKTVAAIRELADRKGKEFVCYLSMAFGNPYGDPWSIEIAEKWIGEIDKFNVKYISFSDTIGVAKPDAIEYFFNHLTKVFSHIEFGAHFHTRADTWREKVEAAYKNGCLRFDGAIKGYGGCPMAKDDLTGNMPTENLVAFFDEMKEDIDLNRTQLQEAMKVAGEGISGVSDMRIVTWNRNGAFRKKFDSLNEFQADILVIQECEDPNRTNNIKYKDWAANFIWTGENRNKGLGIFAKENLRIQKLEWETDGLKYFIPCKVNDDFNLLGCWCHGANSPTFGYIGQFWKYLQLNSTKLRKSVIAGDFNSNVIWDKLDRWWNHSDVVRELKEIEIESLYHRYFKEEQGKESQPTFFLQKNKNKPYHIDYVFANISKSIKAVMIGKKEKWLELSDHLPVFCEIE